MAEVSLTSEGNLWGTTVSLHTRFMVGAPHGFADMTNSSIHLSIHPSSYVPSLDHADIPWGEVPRNLGSWGCYGTVPVDTPWPQACDRQVPPLSLELCAGSEAPAV